MSEKPAPTDQSEFEQEATSRIGRTLAAKYRLDAVIGSGGMAHVFRATNTVIGRTVAIKVLRAEHALNSETVERFLREARTANLVRHPNVIDVIDFGQDADGSSFIVQEFLEGETLFSYACRRQGILPINELSEIMAAVLGAVAEAHAQGVIHRDLKPENVFLSGQRGRRVPKVLDFGISKVLGTDMTAAGMMLGTPAYMAPELARSAKAADPRSDVWAVGVMLFELLTGRVPFEGDTVGAMFYAITTVDAARLADVRPDLPLALSQLVEKCLKRNPAERYNDARELAAALAAALEAPKAAGAPVALSLPPSGDGVTMIGGISTRALTLYSRVPSKSVSGIAESGAPFSREPRSTPGKSQEGPPQSGASVIPRSPSSARRLPTGPRNTPSRDPATRASGMRTGSDARRRDSDSRRRDTPALRRNKPARRLMWTDALAVLGVGLVLAIAILVAFRMAR